MSSPVDRALVEAAEPLEQRPRVEDVAGLGERPGRVDRQRATCGAAKTSCSNGSGRVRALDAPARGAVARPRRARVEPVRLGPAVVVGEGDERRRAPPPADVALARRATRCRARSPASAGARRSASGWRVDDARRPWRRRSRGPRRPPSSASVCSSSAFSSQRSRSGRPCEATTTLAAGRAARARTLSSGPCGSSRWGTCTRRTTSAATSSSGAPRSSICARAATRCGCSRPTCARTAAEPDDPDVHRELRWHWRDHGVPAAARCASVLALERHNHARARAPPGRAAARRRELVGDGRACR